MKSGVMSPGVMNPREAPDYIPSLLDSATPITTKHDNGLFILTVSNFAVASYIHKQHIILSRSVNFRLHLTRKLSIFTVVVI